MVFTQKINPPVGGYAPDFELPGVDSQVHHLARYLEKFRAVAVVFLGNQSIYANNYLERLKQLQTEFSSQGFTLIGINSNDGEQFPEENFPAMKSFAKDQQLNFPYIRDYSQDVGKSFGTQVIPEAFLIDKKAIIRYRGSIDDSPESAETVTISYLRNSITALLQGQEIEPKTTEVMGSPITWRS